MIGSSPLSTPPQSDRFRALEVIGLLDIARVVSDAPLTSLKHSFEVCRIHLLGAAVNQHILSRSRMDFGSIFSENFPNPGH